MKQSNLFMKFKAIILAVLLAFSVGMAEVISASTADEKGRAARRAGNENEALMGELQEVIANRGKYLAEKEASIRHLRQELAQAPGPEAKFEALQHLYDSYNAFNTDSAYNISVSQETLAKQIGNPVFISRARMNRANILCATGMYYETLVLMDSVDYSGLPDYLRPYYFHVKRTVYGRLADYAAFESDREKYLRLTEDYRDSILSVNPPESLPYVITKADGLNIKGKPREAIKLLDDFMRKNNLSEHDQAICAWTLAESYRLTGDKAKRKEMMLLSSISDLKSSVREYIAPRDLALMLYEEGDLNRAYELMNIAVDDASKCNARQRIVELNNFYPKINSIYVKEMQKQRNRLSVAIIVITLLAVMLVFMLVSMRKQMLRVSKARKELESAYARLNHATEQIKASNERLQNANMEIAEISQLKEVYIGQYMDQCVSYIDKFDSYRKTLGKLLSTGKIDSLKKALSSTAVTDEQLKEFYSQFDRTFLILFPSFVEDFNKLLQPEEAIIPKKVGSLNTELRIFALIRLGIVDSAQIAKFLRYSLTTIYNYRTRVRNKALGDRNLLETEVAKIGRN